MEINRLSGMANMRWQTAKVFDARPGLKATLASQIAYALDETPVLYLHASISSAEDEDALVTIAAFTETYVALAFSKAAPITICVARASLRSLTLQATPDLFQGGFEQPLPLLVSLDYGLPTEEPTIVLGGASQTPRNARELEAFIPGLRADLR